ncbi:MAG: helix-turn-helix transcriptional regulator [Treponema sp.]|nr:helix-turn-helix transcriptional regulator [Treponema sp.]
MENTMGKMIAAKRKERGMSQLELAEKMGVTDKAVSKWERDLSCPDIASIPKLADMLGLSVDELMRAKEDFERPSKIKTANIVSLIFRALCIAMGVAVVVLAVLEELDEKSAFLMLGIGLSCAGLALFEK